jgi:aspartate dehydrogenase
LSPSGGIGGLDALETACLAGVDEASIEVAKPPRRGRDRFVESAASRSTTSKGPLTLFEGSAREGVPHFPQNVNIAAILALAGSARTARGSRSWPIPADPEYPHHPRVRALRALHPAPRERPPPENPKTSWLACYSALAALQALGSPVRYGT